MKVGGDVVCSCIWQLTKAALRDSFRNKFTRSSLVKHGVRVNVTEQKRLERSKRNNKKGEFIFKENVKGWLADKHRDYMELLKKRGMDDDNEEENVANKVRDDGPCSMLFSQLLTPPFPIPPFTETSASVAGR